METLQHCWLGTQTRAAAEEDNQEKAPAAPELGTHSREMQSTSGPTRPSALKRTICSSQRGSMATPRRGEHMWHTHGVGDHMALSADTDHDMEEPWHTLRKEPLTRATDDSTHGVPRVEVGLQVQEWGGCALGRQTSLVHCGSPWRWAHKSCVYALWGWLVMNWS